MKLVSFKSVKVKKDQSSTLTGSSQKKDLPKVVISALTNLSF